MLPKTQPVLLLAPLPVLLPLPLPQQLAWLTLPKTQPVLLLALLPVPLLLLLTLPKALQPLLLTLLKQPLLTLPRKPLTLLPQPSRSNSSKGHREEAILLGQKSHRRVAFFMAVNFWALGGSPKGNSVFD